MGRAGRLLDDLLLEAGWNRKNVFITNILKCRPPDNRDPSREEARNCLPYLDLQIKVINPEYILCLGRVATLNLLKPPDVNENYWFNRSLRSFRGVVHHYQGIKTVCTLHPSYLLRNYFAEKEFLHDLKMIPV